MNGTDWSLQLPVLQTKRSMSTNALLAEVVR